MNKTPKMQNRIRLFFFSITCCIIFVFLVLFCIYSIHSEKREYIRESEKKADAIAYDINRELNTIFETSQNVSANPFLTEALKEKESELAYYDSFLLLKRFFSSFTRSGNVESEYIIYPFDKTIPENQYVENIERLSKNDGLYSSLQEMDIYSVCWENTADRGVQYVSLFRNIIDSGKSIGILEARIPKKLLNIVIDNVGIKDYENVLILSANGEAVFERGASENTDFLTERTLSNGYLLKLSAPSSSVYAQSYFQIATAIVLVILLIIAFYFLYGFAIARITKPFSELVATIDEDETLLLHPDKIQLNYDEDTLRLSEKFKEMAIRINQMRSGIEKINAQKKKAELKGLQSSINPHMLYNSLSVLNWRMMEYNDEEMTELISYMVEYYRSVLSNGDTFIPVADEFKMIEQYLKIIKVAYNQQFEVEYSLSDELRDGYTLKQIMQPAVENAIMHGIKGIDGARLSINAYRQGNDTVFEILDNGHGMNKEQIATVLSGKTPEGKIKKGYGIKNTIERVKLFCGSEYGMSIESEQGKGTKTIIRTKYFAKDDLNN